MLFPQQDCTQWKKDLLVYWSCTCCVHSMIKSFTQFLRTEGFTQVYPDVLHMCMCVSVLLWSPKETGAIQLHTDTGISKTVRFYKELLPCISNHVKTGFLDTGTSCAITKQQSPLNFQLRPWFSQNKAKAEEGGERRDNVLNMSRNKNSVCSQS